MRVVVALGGNALLQRKERPDADIQEHHVLAAVQALAPIAADHDLVVTHGNGPQVGVLAYESQSDPDLSRPYPFDVLGAQTQGMIGYWLVQALDNALPGRRAVALFTQTVVSEDDPAWDRPTKFVGPVYQEELARTLAEARNWSVQSDDGGGWRRVVASPEPLELVELGEIRTLMADGTIVVCSGGGGIPVIRRADGRLRGVEAVVDKDLSAALLAREIGADALVILTDVAGVEADHGTPEARALTDTTVSALRSMQFPAGSMGPKVEAVCRFVEATRGLGAIGRLEDAELLLAGKAGTIVHPE